MTQAEIVAAIDVGRIRQDLYAISDHYDETLEPTSTNSVAMPTKAADGEKMRYAPKAMKEAPPPIGLHILDARRDALTDMHFWARFTLGNVKDIEGNTLNVYIDGADIHALCRFVAHWAERIVADHAEEAEDLAAEAAKHANTLKALAYPSRRDWALLGRCPTPTDEGECGGKVRAYPDSNPYRDPECATCGTVAPLEQWMAQMLPDAADLGTAAEVISCVAMRSKVVLSHDQLRQWATRQLIGRHGKDAKGRTLYSKGEVLERATTGATMTA